MATGTGKPGGSPKAKQPSGNVLERILRSNTSAELVGAMVYNGINIPEDDYHGSPIRLQLSRIITMPLDNESRNIIATFVLHWSDPTNPTKLRAEAGNAATVKPFATGLIDALVTVNAHNIGRASVAAKRQAAERKLDEMIGRLPGRPNTDANPVIDAVMGQGSAGGGNDLISMLLVLNELGESTPFPIRIGPRRTEPIERRREWAEGAAKWMAGLAATVVIVLSLGLGAATHWAFGLLLAIVLVVGLVWLVVTAVKRGSGWLLRKAFPQFDEQGFRKKALQQCETTRAFLGLSTADIVAMGLEHKFLEEVDGELRKEGLVYNRFDEQIDDWVRDYLGLAPAHPVTPKTGLVDRLLDLLDRLDPK